MSNVKLFDVRHVNDKCQNYLPFYKVKRDDGNTGKTMEAYFISKFKLKHNK